MTIEFNKPFQLSANFQKKPIDEIHTIMKTNSLTYLYAIEDDGITWGKFDNNKKLTLSKDGFLADGSEKLQQVYLFGQFQQILLWRNGQQFSANSITDVELPDKDSDGLETYREEKYFLWGSAKEVDTTEPFSRLVEEDRGFQFAVPIKLEPGDQAALTVRHYFDYDNDGQCTIAFSRLVDLVKMEGNK